MANFFRFGKENVRFETCHQSGAEEFVPLLHQVVVFIRPLMPIGDGGGALLKRAAQQPVLFVMEDLHWADASTLELLNLLVDQVPTARILALLTFRPEFAPPWGARSHVAHVTLTRLPQQQTETMIARLTQGKALPAEVHRQLVLKTDGVPLFIEELTKMVLESGLLSEREERYELTGPLPPLAIPTTLHDSLMARVDKLATVKEVLQVGATLGQEFTYEVLRAVAVLDEDTLQSELSRLVEAELLYQPIGYRWANNLKKYDAPEPKRFTGYYDAMAAATSVRLAQAQRMQP